MIKFDESNKLLQIKGVLIENQELENLVQKLADHKDTIQTLEFEEVKILEMEWKELMTVLINTQTQIETLKMQNIDFFFYTQLIHLVKRLCLKQKPLTNLDFQHSKMGPIQYGIIMNIIKNTENEINLSLNGCEFTQEDEENFINFVKNQNKLKKVNFDNTNFDEDLISSLSKIVIDKSTLRTSEIHNDLQLSKIKDLALSKIINAQDKSKKLVLLNYSTEINLNTKPNLSATCTVCTRQSQFTDLYICTSCQESSCKYCHKNQMFCYTCFGCSKSSQYEVSKSFKTQIKTYCASCLECPICKNVLQTKKLNNGDKPYFFQCKFCFWNSKNYAVDSITSDQLVSENFEVTNLIIKNLTASFTISEEYQKKIAHKTNQKTLIEILEKDFMDSRKQKKREEFAKRDKNFSNYKKKDLQNFFSNEFKFENQSKIVLVSPFKQQKHLIEDIDNPIFLDMIKEQQDLTQKQFIDKYRENNFNLKLFMDFPLRVYRNKKDYIIPKKKFKLLFQNHCKKCKKILVNYLVQKDRVSIKNTSFFYENNITYLLQKIYPLEGDEETFRIKFRLVNLTNHNIHFELKPGDNCEFSDGRSVYSQFFEFNSNQLNFTTLSVDIDSITQKTSEEIFIDFHVDPHKEKVEFSLKQVKKIETKNNSVFEDEIFFNFGTLEEFYRFLKLGYQFNYIKFNFTFQCIQMKNSNDSTQDIEQSLMQKSIYTGTQSIGTMIAFWIRMTMGIGVMTLPYYVKQMGLLAGAVGIIVGGFLTLISFKQLLEASEHTQQIEYYKIIEILLSPRILSVFRVLHLFELLLIFTVYCITAWDLFKYFLYCIGAYKSEWIIDAKILEWNEYNPQVLQIRILYFLVLFFLLLPLMFKKDLSSLKLISFLFLATMVTLLGVLTLEAPFFRNELKKESDYKIEYYFKPFSLEWILTFFSLIMSYYVQPFALGMKKELKNPTLNRIKKVAYTSGFLLMLLFLVFGLLCYYSFGDLKTPKLQMLRVPYENKSGFTEAIVKILVVIFMLCNDVGLSNFNPIIRTYINSLITMQNERVMFIVTSMFTFIFGFLVAIIMPNITTVFWILGLIICNFNGYIIPCFMSIKVGGNKILNFSLITFYFVCMAVGCYYNIRSTFSNNQFYNGK